MVEKMPLSPFGDHFGDVSAPGRHVNSDKEAVADPTRRAGNARSSLTAAVCTVLPRQSVAVETQLPGGCFYVNVIHSHLPHFKK